MTTARNVPVRTSPDVIIVGAGIIGCALARELAKTGARVTLFDRGIPGAEASSAAAGMLGPRAECDAPGPLLALGMASLERYPAVIAALRDETGIDPEYECDGIVYVALSEEEEETLARRGTWQHAQRLPVERLTADDVRRLEPDVTTRARSGLLFPHDHRVDNVRLTRAYAVAAAQAGVDIRSGEPVSSVRVAGGRVQGVEVGHELTPAGVVVNAAGAWANMVAAPAGTMAVRPVRGQMVAVAGMRPTFRHAIYSRDVYLVPRRDGRVLAGSTYEEAGFDRRVTAEAVAGILTRAVQLAPVLGGATFGEAWAGLRPGTHDGLPILGADPALEGLYYATGHYRNGILLTPVTAHALSELIVAGRSSIDLAPFSPERFARTPN